MPPRQFDLGKAGLVTNAIAFVYSVFVLFWVAWPPAKDVTAQTFNWASVMFVGIVLFSLIFYIVSGRKTYDGPVVLVRQPGW